MTTPERDASASTEEARGALERAIARFNAGDYEEYLESFTDDLESFTGIVTPLRWVGVSAWKELIAGLGELASATYEQRDVSYRGYGRDTVLANAYFVFTTVSRAGEVETQTGRASHTLVRENGSWRIANQHYSPMF